ncbi:hypothetical protein [Parabacteroides sp.]
MFFLQRVGTGRTAFAYRSGSGRGFRLYLALLIDSDMGNGTHWRKCSCTTTVETERIQPAGIKHNMFYIDRPITGSLKQIMQQQAVSAHCKRFGNCFTLYAALPPGTTTRQQNDE